LARAPPQEETLAGIRAGFQAEIRGQAGMNGFRRDWKKTPALHTKPCEAQRINRFISASVKLAVHRDKHRNRTRLLVTPDELEDDPGPIVVRRPVYGAVNLENQRKR
jgi:hypothetical protein